jgi:hypothetical protein
VIAVSPRESKKEEGKRKKERAEGASKKGKLRKAFFGALHNCNENRYQFSALLADRLKAFGCDQVGFREQIKPIRCFLDFSQTIPAFRDKLIRSSPDSLSAT